MISNTGRITGRKITAIPLFCYGSIIFVRYYLTNPKLFIMKKLFTVLLFLAVTLTAGMSQTVDGILSKYFESIGGVEKWKELKTMKLTGQIPTPQGEFTFEMNRKAPNKMIISLDVMGQKLVPQAYDGEVAWMLNPFTGNTAPQKIPEEQTKDLIRDAVFEDPFIDFVSKGHEVTYEGTGDVDGVKCLILKLVQNKGKGADESTSSYYFDSESYLPVLVKQTMSNEQMGTQDVDIYMSDYQDIGNGLMMAFNIDQRIGGQSVQAIKFTKAVANEDIADDIFKFPGE
jgi:outer membrane lipoprotein-sorting protein